MSKRYIFGRACLFSAALAALVACDDGEPKIFKEGRAQVVRGDFGRAVATLNAYLSEHPEGKHASRAGLFLGKAYLGMGKLEEAAQAWEATVRDYPDTREGRKCRYKLAIVALLSGDRRSALEKFESVGRAADGPLTAEARAMAKYLRSAPASVPSP